MDDPIGARRIFRKFLFRADRAPDQLAPAIRTLTLELLRALNAECAFETANHGLLAGRRKIAIATLAIRAQGQHGRLPGHR